MYRETTASPFLTEHAEGLIKRWLQSRDRHFAGYVLHVPDPMEFLPVEWERLESNEPFEPIPLTSVRYHRRFGDDDIFFFMRPDEQIYYCPQTRKFYENV